MIVGGDPNGYVFFTENFTQLHSKQITVHYWDELVKKSCEGCEVKRHKQNNT